MSSWKDHTTVALLGVSKAPLPSAPAPLRPVLQAEAGQPGEIQFLTQAGALALWRRAGWQPAQNTTSVSACAAESTRVISQASVGHLRTMLAGRQREVLVEWLEEVARRGKHLPPEFLPGLLDRAQQDRSLRSAVLNAGGSRAAWLAAQNPRWSFAPVETVNAWETGSRDQRIALLKDQRTKTPEEARTLVESVWKSEPADIRTAFLAAMEIGLSTADTAFLEATLDDRSKEVRRAAIDLLARLPGSPFVARMRSRAQPLIAFKPGGLLSRASLEVQLPADPDAAATRDGLDPKALGNQRQLGDKAVLLVLILSAIPLSHWTETTKAEPAALLKAAAKDEFARALATGWAWAAIRQKNVAWAEALLSGDTAPHTELLPGPPLLNILPESARATRLDRIIREGAMKKVGSAGWIDSLAELTMLAGAVPTPLLRTALAALKESVGGGLPWHFRSPIETWFLRLPPAYLPEALAGWPTSQEDIAPLAELLSFRHDALTALAQP